MEIFFELIMCAIALLLLLVMGMITYGVFKITFLDK